MNKTQCSLIKAKVLQALKSIEGDLDVTFSPGNGSYDSGSFTFKLTATQNAADGTARTKEEIDFEKSCYLFGLQPSDLGKSFFSQGRKFTIVGLKPRNHKYPIIATGSRGGRYKFPATVAKEVV